MRRTLLALLLAGGIAGADETGTRLGLMIGACEQVGSLGSRYGLGWALGAEAGWVPSWAGFVWALTYSLYTASDANDPIQKLTLWDMSVSFRARAPLRKTGIPIYGYGQVGAAILRASTALPPDDSMTFFGPKVGVGVEARWSWFFIGVEADYGLLTGGPSGLQVVSRFGAGR
jgi:hypothetical protein